MDDTGYIALSRMMVQQNVLDTRASNIANMSTPGFKAANVLFSDYLVREGSNGSAPGEQQEQMVQDRATYRDTAEGPLTRTGNPLDLAINGTGFFVIDAPQGQRYTRAGRFSLSPAGQIVDQQGNTVQGAGGNPIAVPPGDSNITIAADGTVSTNTGQIGKLHVVQFTSPQAMIPEGNTLLNTQEAPQDADKANIMQGAFEGSNVESIVELTRMMAEMREFDFASQFVDTDDQRLQSSIDKIVKTS